MAACDFPFYVKNPAFPARSQDRQVPVPCGSCPECLKRRVSGWSFRLRQQEKVSRSALFITLTYDTKTIPITENGFTSLAKSDFQKFIKRLRKARSRLLNAEWPVKYYAVGEYGSKTQRPHYHAIIFNVMEDDILSAWRNGECHVGSVTGASIAYTLKYMQKGRIVPAHARDDREKEFSLMSKGLGANYIDDAIRKYHTEDFRRVYLTVEGGMKVAMPRYYKDKIFTAYETLQLDGAELKVLTQQRIKQQQYFQRLSEANEEAKRLTYLQANGNLDNYDYDNFQSKRQKINNLHRKTRGNRGTI